MRAGRWAAGCCHWTALSTLRRRLHTLLRPAEMHRQTLAGNRASSIILPRHVPFAVSADIVFWTPSSTVLWSPTLKSCGTAVEYLGAGEDLDRLVVALDTPAVSQVGSCLSA